jgi:hypothetical protein
MNIFFLDLDPKICAEYHCDKHIGKMLIESCQLLCSVYWLNHCEAPYKLSYVKHPCSIWTRESYQNFEWLLSLGKELAKQFEIRYTKKHKSSEILDWIDKNKPLLSWFSETKFTTPPFIMPDKYKSNNIVESYRDFYKGEKVKFASWKYTTTPGWWLHL